MYDECLFEQLDYSGVKMFNSAVLVPLQSGKKKALFWYFSHELKVRDGYFLSNLRFSIIPFIITTDVQLTAAMCFISCSCFSGEQLLMAGEVFTIRPLQLYAVTQQLLQGKPTCANGDAKTDLGHILDFTCRLKYLKVSYTCTNTGDITPTRL